MRISIMSLLFMALANNGLCQTNGTNSTDAPDISPDLIPVGGLCPLGYFRCGAACCDDYLGQCASDVVEVPKTTTYVTTTTIVATTTVPETNYFCVTAVSPCNPPCRLPFVCIRDRCTIES